MHPKRVTIWCGFWSKGIIGLFSSKMSKERWLQSMAIVIGQCHKNFCSQKLKTRILATFGFNGMALRATQPKLHWIFAPYFWRSHYLPQSWCCLATTELRFDTVGMLFVRCRQRQVLRRQARDNWLFKGQYSGSHWWNTAAQNR